MKPRTALAELNPGELATLLLELGESGIRQRARGRCLGVELSVSVALVHGHAFITAPNTRAARRRLVRVASRHARQGHATGCGEFGLAMPEAAGVLERHDCYGAAQLVLDTFREAIAVVQHATAIGQPWTETDAREILDTSIRRTITPRPIRVRSDLDQTLRGRRETQRAGRGLRRTTARPLNAQI